MSSNPIFAIAAATERRAREVAEEAGIVAAWESVGAQANLVGSLRMGLMMTHRDIDFHIYTDRLEPAVSFSAMAKIAAHPAVQRVEYNNLAGTVEECLEWHAWFRDRDGDVWQFDMIHILRGSRYDGHMEMVADRIVKALTPELRQIILQLKYDTPESEKIMGIEYYHAVFCGGVRTYDELVAWRQSHPADGVVEWVP